MLNYSAGQGFHHGLKKLQKKSLKKDFTELSAILAARREKKKQILLKNQGGKDII